MTKIEIPEINFVKEIPSSFDEMSSDDYIRFIKLWMGVQNKLHDVNYLKTELVFHFLNIKHSPFRWQRLSEDEKLLISSNINYIATHLDFLVSERDVDGKIHVGIPLTWTKNHIPEYRGLKGPADALADITWIEYKDAMMAAIDYIENEDVDDLARLVAILYRKKYLFSKRRRAYDPERVSQIMKKTKKIPFPTLYGIFLFFLSCEKYIREGTFIVDREEISFSSLFKKSDGADEGSNGTWMTELLYNLAETGVFGNAKETSRQNLFDILFRLYQVHKDYKRRMKK